MTLLPNVKTYLQLAFKRSELFYLTYRKLRDRTFGEKVCSAASDIVLEGFESSGNSYLYVALEQTHSDLSIAHHIHKVAHLKRAIRFGSNVVIVFREPAAAIASRVAGFGCDVSMAMHEYIDFYTFVLANGDFFVLEFSEVTTQIDRVINSIERFIGREQTEIDLQVLDARIRRVLKQRSERNNRILRLPDHERSKKRDTLVEQIRNSANWHYADRIYRELCSRKAELA